MTDSDIRKKIVEWQKVFSSTIEDIVVQQGWEGEFDYTLESLQYYDDLVDELIDGNDISEANFDLLVAVIGSYLAEVIQQNFDGEWSVDQTGAWVYNIETDSKYVGAAVFAWVHKRIKSDELIADKINKLIHYLNEEDDTDDEGGVSDLSGWKVQSIINTWLADSAGLILGEFECSANEEVDNKVTTFSIHLDGTPPLMVSDTNEFKFKEVGENKAVLSVLRIDDNRRVKVIIEADEVGVVYFYIYIMMDLGIDNYDSVNDLVANNVDSDSDVNLEVIKNGGSLLVRTTSGVSIDDDLDADDLNNTLMITMKPIYSLWDDLFDLANKNV
jgi:hypothetical protein